MSRIITHASKRQNSEVFSINKLQDLKVRPIKGGPKCPSRKFSDLIYTLLKPFLKHGKNYIRDSIYFLNKCDRNLDGNTVIPTFLVVCLYANIPHLFRLEVVRYFLLKYKDDFHPRFNITFLLESVGFILKKHLFLWQWIPFTALEYCNGCFHQPVQTLAWGTMKLNVMILLNWNTTTTLTSTLIPW